MDNLFKKNSTLKETALFLEKNNFQLFTNLYLNSLITN